MTLSLSEQTRAVLFIRSLSDWGMRQSAHLQQTQHVCHAWTMRTRRLFPPNLYITTAHNPACLTTLASLFFSQTRVPEKCLSMQFAFVPIC